MSTTAPNEDAEGKEPGFRRTISLFWPLWLMPVLVIGGLVIAVEYAPDSIESFYTDTAMPFLIAYWIGLGFTTTWHLITESMRVENTPPGIVAAVGVLSALILLSMLGGISLLWEEPWLFGAAIAPGFALARPLLERWLLGRRPQAPATTNCTPEGPA